MGILKSKEGGWDVMLFQHNFSDLANRAATHVTGADPLICESSRDRLVRSDSIAEASMSPRELLDNFECGGARFVNPAGE